MARKKNEVATSADLTELMILIDSYAYNKAVLDSQKVKCDTLNKDIKDAMSALDTDTAEGTDVVAKIVIQNRESVNEEKMLEILKKDWSRDNGTIVCPYIKTKFYIDMDELEKAIYRGDLSKEVLLQLEECKTTTEVKTLRLSKRR